MPTGIECARELLSRCAVGKSRYETAAALRQRFPDVSVAELERGALIAFDQVDLCRENHKERAIFDLPVTGALDVEFSAAVEAMKCTADNVIPQRPRRNAS